MAMYYLVTYPNTSDPRELPPIAKSHEADFASVGPSGALLLQTLVNDPELNQRGIIQVATRIVAPGAWLTATRLEVEDQDSKTHPADEEVIEEPNAQH